MRISDWSSDVCSSDLCGTRIRACTWRSRTRAASPTARTAARTSCWSTEPGRDGPAGRGMSRALTVVQLLPALESGGVERSTIEIAAEIGSAACRERVCQSVLFQVYDVSLKKKRQHQL